MENNKSKSTGCLFLIVIVIVGYFIWIDGDPPIIEDSLPDLSQTVFVDVEGDISDEEVQIKIILNNDKTGSVTARSDRHNNASDQCNWQVLVENSEMQKIQLIFRGSVKALLVLYKNKEAAYAIQSRQFLGNWYQ